MFVVSVVSLLIFFCLALSRNKVYIYYIPQYHIVYYFLVCILSIRLPTVSCAGLYGDGWIGKATFLNQGSAKSIIIGRAKICGELGVTERTKKGIVGGDMPYHSNRGGNKMGNTI